jgi:hypothetical protein
MSLTGIAGFPVCVVSMAEKGINEPMEQSKT